MSYGVYMYFVHIFFVGLKLINLNLLQFISAPKPAAKTLGKKGVANIVLVEGVRTPFVPAFAEYNSLLAHDLARASLQ